MQGLVPHDEPLTHLNRLSCATATVRLSEVTVRVVASTDPGGMADGFDK